MRGGVALLGLVLIAGACSQPLAMASPQGDRSVEPPAVADGTQSPTPWPTVPPDATRPPKPAGVDDEVDSWIQQRWGMGLRHDLEWVLRVARDPRADDRTLEMPALPEEADAFLAWQNEHQFIAGQVQRDAAGHPDTFGGLYIDTPNHRVVSLWTDDLAANEARLRRLVGQAAPIALFHVEHPEAYLRELQDRVPLDDEFYASALAKPTGVGVDIKANTVSIDVSSANPDAPRQVRTKVATFLGVPESIVSVESDGTGIELLPFGEIEIHVVGRDGHRLPGTARLDWRYEGDQIGTCGPGGDMWIGFDDRGVLRTQCNPGTWTILVTTEDGAHDLGRGTAVIEANELTKIKITLDRDP